MFLDELNEDQRKSYLALATRMILADGDVAPEEDAALESIKAALGSGIVAPPEEVFGSTNADVFGDRKSRIIAVLEVLILAYSDEHLHTDESSVLKEICGALEIGDEDLEALTGLAKRAVANADDAAVRAEVEAMMSGG